MTGGCTVWAEHVQPTHFYTTSLYVPAQPPLPVSDSILAMTDMHTLTHTHTHKYTSHTLSISLPYSLLSFTETHMRTFFLDFNTFSLLLYGWAFIIHRECQCLATVCLLSSAELNSWDIGCWCDTAVADMPHYCCCKCQSTKEVTHSSTGRMVIAYFFYGQRG